MPSPALERIDYFEEMDLGDDVLDALEDMGMVRPTEIQAYAIPRALQGTDVIGRAETGSGKTLAFGCPIADRIDPDRVSVLALILCPTRELAQQVAGVLRELCTYKEIRVVLVVGGENMRGQIQEIQKGCQILVGTPGRVLDLIRSKWLVLGWVETVVLDEADEMLEIGFLDDVTAILDATPAERQTLLFSATFPPPILEVARNYMRDPVTVGARGRHKPAGSIIQYYLLVHERDRSHALERILDTNPDHIYLVFCDSRTEVDELYRKLRGKPYEISSLHGGYEQPVRRRIMEAFRAGRYRALIATDVAARGLDLTKVTHVINYSLPRSLDRYLHRIGRTGRAGAKGEAITFVGTRDRRDFEAMVRRGKLDIRGVELPSQPGPGGRPRRAKGGRGRGRGPFGGARHGKGGFGGLEVPRKPGGL